MRFALHEPHLHIKLVPQYPQVRVRNARLAFQIFNVVEQKNLKVCK
jgi:hypothetical protein